MKRVSGSHGESVQPVKLYLDHVMAIVEALSACDQPVKIRTEAYEFDSVDELVKHTGTSLRKLDLSIDNPYVSVTVEGSRAWVWRHDGSAVTRGIFASVLAIVQSARTPFIAVALGPWTGPILGLVLVILVEMTRITATKLWLAVAGLATLVAWLIWAWWIQFSTGYTGGILLAKRRDRPTFFKDKGTTILAGIITGVITGIVTTYFLVRMGLK